MDQPIDLSGFHIKAGEVSIVVPCLEFVLFLDRTDDAGILDFYQRARAALGSSITHYLAESMKGYKRLDARGESMVPTWFTRPREGKLAYYMTMADNDPNKIVTASTIEISIFRRPVHEVTPKLRAQWKVTYEEQKSKLPYPGSQLRVSVPLDHPLADPAAIRDWILDFSLVKNGADFTGHCGYALNHYLQPIDRDLYDPAKKALASFVLRYPGLGFNGGGIQSRILRYEPKLSEFVPLIERANWLNLVCDKTLDLIGGRSHVRTLLGDDLPKSMHEVAHGVAIQAGLSPQVGDLGHRDFVEPYRRVAKVLRPIRIDEIPGMGGWFMQTETNEWLNALDKEYQ